MTRDISYTPFVIIDKNADAEQIIKDFPIRWTIDRVSGLYYIIDRCKRTGLVMKLKRVGETNYSLEVVKPEETKGEEND